MTNTAERNAQNRSRRTRIRHIWHGHHPAWWYRLIARTAAGHFAGLLASGFLEAGIEEVRGQQVVGTAAFLLHGVLPVATALPVALYSYRTMRDPEPPERPVSRKEWADIAANKGFPVALGVFYAAWLPSLIIAGIILGLLLGIAGLFFSLPDIPDLVSGLTGFALSLPLPWMLAKRAFMERSNQEMAALEAATPPGLSLAIELHRRAEMFRGHAQALEDAMEQAAAISEQVQNEIRLEHEQLGQLHEQALHQARLNEVTPEQARALARMLDDQHTQGERRARKSNFWNGLLWFLVGLAAQLFVTIQVSVARG
jgi:hypothetical protein